MGFAPGRGRMLQLPRIVVSGTMRGFSFHSSFVLSTLYTTLHVQGDNYVVNIHQAFRLEAVLRSIHKELPGFTAGGTLYVPF